MVMVPNEIALLICGHFQVVANILQKSVSMGQEKTCLPMPGESKKRLR
jgi:hypothetical protein